MPIEWNRLLSDPKTLALVQSVLASGKESFQPTIGPDGDVVYREVADILGGDAVQRLEVLAKEGVLERKSESRLLGCPVHENSFDLAPRLKCPNCGSMLLKKGSLYQHSCGYIGSQEGFGANCPRCGKPSPTQSLKMMGGWYECESCNNRFAAPNLFLFCRKFNHDFPFQQARLVDQASYRLTPVASSELKDRLRILLLLVEGLRSKNYEVTVYGTLPGVSGVRHTFDFIIQEKDVTIPVDVKQIAQGLIGVSAVLATYAKALDTKSSPSVLVAVPAATEDAKKSITAYGMILVEGEEPNKIVESLASSLGNSTAKMAPAA